MTSEFSLVSVHPNGCEVVALCGFWRLNRIVGDIMTTVRERRPSTLKFGRSLLIGESQEFRHKSQPLYGSL